MIRVLFKRPGEPVEVVTVPVGLRGLREMERLMGCKMFDHVGLALEGANEFGLYVDDEGLLKGLAPNILNPRSGTPLVGPILLVKHDSEATTDDSERDLTDEEIVRWTAELQELAP